MNRNTCVWCDEPITRIDGPWEDTSGSTFCPANTDTSVHETDADERERTL